MKQTHQSYTELEHSAIVSKCFFSKALHIGGHIVLPWRLTLQLF